MSNHEEELQKIHIMFNQEIIELKEYYNMKIANLEMKINEDETRLYNIQYEVTKIIRKLTKLT